MFYKNDLSSFVCSPKYLASFTVLLEEYSVIFFYVYDAREQAQNLLHASQASYHWVTTPVLSKQHSKLVIESIQNMPSYKS